MKKVICILISLIFIFTLVSCNTENTVVVTDPGAGYSIEKEDGNYYLLVDEIYNEENKNGDFSCLLDVAPAIEFDSVKEMREKIIGGDLTDAQKKTMAKFEKDENGKIIILDLNNLCEALLPDDYAYMYVSWHGSGYQFGLKNGGYYQVLDDVSKFEECYQRRFMDPIQKNPITNVKKTSDRDATEYYLKTSVAEKKVIQYKLEVGNREIFVSETYLLSNEVSDSLPFSDVIPLSVELLGKTNETYFNAWISTSEFSERPSVEWLSQFGVEPLETE